MLDAYSDWLEAFIGEFPKIKEYDGKKLRYKLFGRSNAYASYQVLNKTFGYNKELMNNLDESDIMAFAAHEAGHHWTIKNKVWAVIMVQLLMCVVMLLNLFILYIAISIGFLCAIPRYIAKIESDAEKFVNDVLGPNITYNNLMTIYCDSIEKNGIKEWESMRLDQIKRTLREMNINYENYVEA